MLIGELERRSGVSAKTIRYYEEVGVLPPPERADNGYRWYDERAVDLVAFVKDAQAAGLTLEEIGDVMLARAEGRPTCRHVTEIMQTHLDEVVERIRKLQSARAVLRRLVDRAAQLDPADCTDPVRCQTIEARSG